MTVVLLLALIWAVVLVPPAVRAHAERREAFLVSFGPAPPPAPSSSRPARRRYSRPVHRRRQIAGGLLVAMAATLLVGLLPTFRVLLVVHLFLLDSFLAYVALLAHLANRAARHAALARVDVEPQAVVPRPRSRPGRKALPGSVLLPAG